MSGGGGFTYIRLRDLWCHASESVNLLMLIKQLALQIRKDRRSDSEEAKLD
jgi:hypothetical protein